jgi:rare lipoprotein A
MQGFRRSPPPIALPCMAGRLHLSALLIALALGACSSVPPRPPAGPPPPTAPPASGGYYLNDGPGANAPPNLDAIPDAVPRLEPLRPAANRPYSVLGREYVPATTLKRYHEIGMASWYGRKYHGQRTSTGEIYDMYAMTAAHPTLALPSYARVTNVATGKSVVVRLNDRGPFLAGRIIDLSYTAAYQLGIARAGSGEVAVDAILPGQIGSTPEVAAGPPVMSVAAATAVDPVAPPVAMVPAGFTVQLGAFANFANATAFLAHVRNQLARAAVEPRVRQAGGLYRVYVGPYPEREEARRMGERITQAFGFPTTVAPN